ARGRGRPSRRGRAPPRRAPVGGQRGVRPSASPAVPRPAGTGAGASGTSPAPGAGAWLSPGRGSPQRSSPILLMPRRRQTPVWELARPFGRFIPHTVDKRKQEVLGAHDVEITPFSQTRGGMCHEYLDRLPPA